MKGRNEELYNLMRRKGYPDGFADLVAEQMNTEYTSQRMIAYVNRAGQVDPEEFADEMLAILSERDTLRDKHIAQAAQQKVNRLYQEGLPEGKLPEGRPQITETADYYALTVLFKECGLDIKVEERPPEGVLKMWRCTVGKGELLAGAVLQFKDGRYVLKDLAVKDGWRKEGIGKAMMRTVLKEAKACGAKEIWGCAKVPEYYTGKGWQIVPDEGAPVISDCQNCEQYLKVCFPRIIRKKL
jgi:N-acetylglutamate synthase-like GNAT family acetyltransferase